MTIRLPRIAGWMATWGLGAFACLYIGYAVVALAVDVPGSFPIDLRLRWFEQHLMYAGMDPQQGGLSDPMTDATHPIVRQQGSQYPPWSYALALVLIPPLDWQAARIYLAALSIVLVGVLGFWARTRASKDARLTPSLVSAATLAIFPIAICISYGQLTLFVTAMLCSSLWFAANSRPIPAGLCLGAACIKPHLALLFIFVTFLQGRWTMLAAAAGLLVLASCVTWAFTGVDPVSMLLATPANSQILVTESGAGRLHNRLLVWLGDQLGPRAAVVVLGALVVAMTGAAVVRWRRALSLETVFAVAAVGAMFLTYRKHYDVVLMAIPMALLSAALVREPRAGLILGWSLLGLSLWAPVRDTAWATLPVFVFDLLVWTGVAVLLMRIDLAGQRGPGHATSPIAAPLTSVVTRRVPT